MKKAFSTIISFGANIIVYIIAILIIVRVGTYAYDFSYDVFGEPVASEYSDNEVRITIESGDGSSAVAKKLKEAGIIDNEAAFTLKAALSSAHLMPGTYVVKASMSADEIIALMSDAENSVVKQKTADELEAEAETEASVDTEAASEESETETEYYDDYYYDDEDGGEYGY